MNVSVQVVERDGVPTLAIGPLAAFGYVGENAPAGLRALLVEEGYPSVAVTEARDGSWYFFISFGAVVILNDAALQEKVRLIVLAFVRGIGVGNAGNGLATRYV